MKSRFVFSQTAWDRFKFFIKGPTAVVHQSMGEAMAYKDYLSDAELKRLLDSYILAVGSTVQLAKDADRDEGLFQKLVIGKENLKGLSYWAKKQIDILKVDRKVRNQQVFEILNKISDRALDLSLPPLKPPQTVKLPSSPLAGNLVSVYNNKNNRNDSKKQTEPFKYLTNKMESDFVSEGSKPTDFYFDYFDKIKTGNDFLFLAVSKVFPEIQTFGKNPTQKSKIESYWKIGNKEKIKNKLEEIAENPWIVRNYPHIPVLLPEAIAKLDKKMNAI